MNSFSRIIGAFIVILLIGCKQSDPVPTAYQLVWSDEFNGTELDDNKWEIQLGDGSQYGLWLWGNNEEQYYTANNVSVENGRLRIKAVAETIGNFEYTSARLRSLDKGDFKYGRIEASIKMDDTEGLWHAFWMLPSEPIDSWPISGEIDIMEYVGNSPNEVLNTLHQANAQGQQVSLGAPVPFNNNGFHTYSIEWDENKITWFVDGEETYAVLRTNTAVSSTWPFDAEFHILLNTAIGGNLGGPVNQGALQTARYMEVDYVRVYQSR